MELQGLTWADYSPPVEGDDLGVLHVRRSVWRGIVGEPKTEDSKSAVPVVPQLVKRLAAFRKLVGGLDCAPMFANGVGKPMDLNALHYRQMRDVIKRSGVTWLGWHGFRRGLASNLNRLGVDDSVIQAILRHSDISVTQACYIKTTRPDKIAAMRKLSATLAKVTRCSDGSARADKNPTTSTTMLQ